VEKGGKRTGQAMDRGGAKLSPGPVEFRGKCCKATEANQAEDCLKPTKRWGRGGGGIIKIGPPIMPRAIPGLNGKLNLLGDHPTYTPIFMGSREGGLNKSHGPSLICFAPQP